MPILEVEIVSTTELQEHLAQKIANEVGVILRADKGTVWVRLRRLVSDQYAENGVGDAPSPVFVRVLKAELPGPVELATQAAHLALAVGKACGVHSDNVHIIFEPPGVGRVAFGGKILE